MIVKKNQQLIWMVQGQDALKTQTKGCSVLPDWISYKQARLTLLGGRGWTGDLWRHLPT